MRDGLDEVIEEGMKAIQGHLRETLKRSLIELYARDTEQTEASYILGEELEETINADFEIASMLVASSLAVTGGYINAVAGGYINIAKVNFK